jgi:hypothetical protein
MSFKHFQYCTQLNQIHKLFISLSLYSFGVLLMYFSTLLSLLTFCSVLPSFWNNCLGQSLLYKILPHPKDFFFSLIFWSKIMYLSYLYLLSICWFFSVIFILKIILTKFLKILDKILNKRKYPHILTFQWKPTFSIQ